MRTLRKVHRWLGLLLALPMLLVALSGTLLLWKDQYFRARWPAVARTAAAEDAAAYPAIVERIETTFGPNHVRIIRFPRPGMNAFQVYLDDESQALVHPGTGDLVMRGTWRTSLPVFLFELHENLLLGARGELANGYGALGLIFLALSGVLLWYPRRASTFQLRHAVPTRAAPAAMLRAHAAAGILVGAGVLLFAVTGAGLVFYTPIGRVASAAFDGTPPLEPSAVVPVQGRARADWRRLLAAVDSVLPEAGPTMYYPGAGSNAVLTFRKSLPGEWHPNGRSYVLVDPYRATVVQSIDARQQGSGTRFMHDLYPVHAAMVGGALLFIVAAISGIGLAWLAITGAWAFLGRRW